MQLDAPAIYRIRIEGTLEADWAESVGGLAVTEVITKEGLTQTTIEGRVQDQAALAGFLIALYEQRRPLLLVEYLKEAAA